MFVQAECSEGGGVQLGSDGGIYAQGFIDAKTRKKKVLLANKGNVKVTVTVPGSSGGIFVYVDETTTGQIEEVSRTLDQSDDIA